jgi:hypothetical protein
MATSFVVGTTRGREAPIEEGPAPVTEEAPVWCVMATDGATVVATRDSAGAPAKGAPTSAGEGDEQPMPGKQLAPVARRSAPGECGGSVEVLEAPIGAANVAAGDNVTDMAALDSGVGVREAPSTDWSAPSSKEPLVDGTCNIVSAH